MRAAFGLGSNLGDRRAHLDVAVEGLRSCGTVVAVSAYRETEPVGGPPQPAYLNAAVVVETALSPRALLDLAQGLEREAGRQRGVRWGPRPLDVDLLLYGAQRIAEPDLVVPHPRLAERGFVLGPLSEIAPEWIVPGPDRSVEDLHADLCHDR